jgi:hypothetical protein
MRMSLVKKRWWRESPRTLLSLHAGLNRVPPPKVYIYRIDNAFPYRWECTILYLDRMFTGRYLVKLGAQYFTERYAVSTILLLEQVDLILLEQANPLFLQQV